MEWKVESEGMEDTETWSRVALSHASPRHYNQQCPLDSHACYNRVIAALR
jgi:hypothetical protein